MNRTTRAKRIATGLLMGGVCLATSITCDPSSGSIEFFRDDHNDVTIFDVLFDDGFHDHHFADDFLFDDCFLLCG